MGESQPETTSEQRLKQTEILLATTAKMINQLTYKQARNSEAIAENTEGIKNLSLTVAQTIELFNDSIKVIQQMQSEIKGMQTENQRMLRHLFGEDQQ
jgi:hypothetical protein